MNENIKIVFVFSGIVLISTILLTFIHQKTAPIISKNLMNKLESSSNGMFPESDFVKDMKDYKELYLKNEVIGYVVESSSYGYSSDINLIVGFNKDKTIREVIVLEQQETPGLGGEITSEKFLFQFKDKKIDDINLKQNSNGIDGVTGATVSSNAVVVAVRAAYEKIQ